MNKKEFNRKFQEILNPGDNGAKLPNLMEMMSNMPMTPMSQRPGEPVIEKQSKAPRIPNVAGQQEKAAQNTLASKYPFLGAR